MTTDNIVGLVCRVVPRISTPPGTSTQSTLSMSFTNKTLD